MNVFIATTSENAEVAMSWAIKENITLACAWILEFEDGDIPENEFYARMLQDAAQCDAFFFWPVQEMAVETDILATVLVAIGAALGAGKRVLYLDNGVFEVQPTVFQHNLVTFYGSLSEVTESLKRHGA